MNALKWARRDVEEIAGNVKELGENLESKIKIIGEKEEQEKKLNHKFKKMFDERDALQTEAQELGLEIAETLHDRTHKALYIKLAKKGNPDALLELAKTVAGKENIKNYGAYFMAMLSKSKKSRGARKKS